MCVVHNVERAHNNDIRRVIWSHFPLLFTQRRPPRDSPHFIKMVKGGNDDDPLETSLIEVVVLQPTSRSMKERTMTRSLH